MTPTTGEAYPEIPAGAYTTPGDPHPDGTPVTVAMALVGELSVAVHESSIDRGTILIDVESFGPGEDVPAVRVVINDDQVWPPVPGPENGCDDCTEEAPCIEHLNDDEDEAVAQVVAGYPTRWCKRSDLGCAIADLTAAGKEGHALYRLRDALRTSS